MAISDLFQFGQVAAMVILATLFIAMIKADIKVIRVQIDGLSENLKLLNTSFAKLSEVLSRSAVMENRLSNAEEDIRELRHGRGFIRPDINGEYSARGKTQAL